MTKVIGLISGTSVDGIDAALVEISGTDVDLKVELLAGATYPYPDDLREQILEVCGGAAISMAQLAQLDDAIARCFAHAATNIQAGHSPAELIGSHGQTVFHRPPVKSRGNLTMGYTLQIGRGALISHLTGITTVSNFRVADIAALGEGAPLVSKIDAYLLSHPQENRCVQNLGGIGNVTYLPARSNPNWQDKILGWDTGPGNALLDLAVQYLSGGTKTYDQDGNWAASGMPCQELVEQWLRHEYFDRLPPKSTGRELFGVEFCQQCLADAKTYNLSDTDILASLTELTVASIVDNYRKFLPQMPDKVLLCGGGSRNLYLKQRLQTLLQSANAHILHQPHSSHSYHSSHSSRSQVQPGNEASGLLPPPDTRCENDRMDETIKICDRQRPIEVLTTSRVGLNADYKEAIAFAVLALWRHQEICGNLPVVTGASRDILLGEIHHAMASAAHVTI